MFKYKSHYFINYSNTPSKSGALVVAKLIEERQLNKNLISTIFAFILISLMILQLSFVYAQSEEEAPITSPITSPEEESPEPSPSESPTPTPSNAPTDSLTVPSGPFSAPSCDDQKPGSTPILLSAVPIGKGKVTLTWAEAKDPVTYYLLTYGLEPGTEMFGNPSIGDANTTSYTVEELSGDQTYYFRVRAGNSCQPGDFSNELAVRVTGETSYNQALGFTTNGVIEGQEASDAGEVSNLNNLLSSLASFWSRILSFFN